MKFGLFLLISVFTFDTNGTTRTRCGFYLGSSYLISHTFENSLQTHFETLKWWKDLYGARRNNLPPKIHNEAVKLKAYLANSSVELLLQIDQMVKDYKAGIQMPDHKQQLQRFFGYSDKVKEGLTVLEIDMDIVVGIMQAQVEMSRERRRAHLGKSKRPLGFKPNLASKSSPKVQVTEDAVETRVSVDPYSSPTRSIGFRQQGLKPAKSSSNAIGYNRGEKQEARLNLVANFDIGEFAVVDYMHVPHKIGFVVK